MTSKKCIYELKVYYIKFTCSPPISNVKNLTAPSNSLYLKRLILRETVKVHLEIIRQNKQTLILLKMKQQAVYDADSAYKIPMANQYDFVEMLTYILTYETSEKEELDHGVMVLQHYQMVDCLILHSQYHAVKTNTKTTFQIQIN